LVLGGGNSAEQDVVQASGPGGFTVSGHLPQPRSDLSAAKLDGRVVVLGGYDATSVAVPGITTSRDGDRWRTVGSLPVPVRYAASAVHDDAVWLFGGERAHVMQRAVQRITPTGRAVVVARLPVPLGHAAAVEVGSRILLIGGRLTDTTLTDRMWWFDPATRQFQRAGRLPHVLADSAVITDRGDIYLLGGESPQVTAQAIRIHPQ
jgi:N-acetylneuraminic acid mutarotase